MDTVQQTTPRFLFSTKYPWHETTWQQFAVARQHHKLPHAMLLTGEQGIGKSLLALRMAKNLLCENSASISADYCGKCQSCRTFEAESNPDYLSIRLLEDKTQIGVDQIRAVSDFIHVSRSYDSYRVVIIDPAERMNDNAANSLLKSLEEPSDNTVIILVCSEAHRLLPTIKSRCQRYLVNTPDFNYAKTWLDAQSTKNKAPLDSEHLLNLAHGKPLLAMTIDAETIESREKFFIDLSQIINHEEATTVIAKRWEKQTITTLLDWQLQLIVNSIKQPFTNTQNSGDEVSTQLVTAIQQFTEKKKWYIYSKLIEHKRIIHTSVNSLIFLENMLLLWLCDNNKGS